MAQVTELRQLLGEKLSVYLRRRQNFGSGAEGDDAAKWDELKKMIDNMQGAVELLPCSGEDWKTKTDALSKLQGLREQREAEEKRRKEDAEREEKAAHDVGKSPCR